MKSVKIGIMTQEQMRARVMSIARGEYKPKASDPKIWFPSMKSLSEVLSDENRALLKIIKNTRPDSLTSLADTTGRKIGNLSRTLKTMSGYGLVEMKRGERNQLRPVAIATDFIIAA